MSARMVDISGKEEAFREAVAEGKILLKRETVRRIRHNAVEKGDVLLVSKIAGMMAAKKTSFLLPLCHTIPLSHVDVDFRLEEDGISVSARVRTRWATGVEMEALTAVAVALLNVWDMVKQYEKDEGGQYPTTRIADIRVVKKIKRADPRGFREV